MVVLNRRGLENFVVQLRNSEGVDVTGEYIILQGDKEGEVEEGEKVHGLWIFEEEEGSTRGVRRACGEAILQCAERAEKGVAPAADTSVNGRVEERRTGMQANAVQVGEPQQPQSQPTATSTGPDLMALLNASRNQTRLPPAHHNALPQRPNIDHLFRKPAPTTDYPW